MNALGENKSRIKYIISALLRESEDDNIEIVKVLFDTIKQHKAEQKVAFQNIRDQIRSIQTIALNKKNRLQIDKKKEPSGGLNKMSAY